VRASRIVFVLFALAGGGWVRGADGAALYAEHCAACHGLDGKARTPAGKKLGAKDLGESKFTDAAIREQILGSAKGEKGKSKMPTFNGKLTDDEIARLVAFVKTFRR
jgi:mono/diheme cytochrome c family protein